MKLSRKFKTRQEIAKDLGMSEKTFRKKLKNSELDIPKGLISPRNQLKIYEFFGVLIITD